MIKSKEMNIKSFVESKVSGLENLHRDLNLIHAMVLYSFRFDKLINNRHRTTFIREQYAVFQKDLRDGEYLNEEVSEVYSKYYKAIQHFFKEVNSPEDFATRVNLVADVLLNSRQYIVKEAFTVKRVIMVQKFQLEKGIKLLNTAFISTTLYDDISDKKFENTLNIIIEGAVARHSDLLVLRNSPKEYVLVELTLMLNPGLCVLPMYLPAATVSPDELEILLIPQDYTIRVVGPGKVGLPPMYHQLNGVPRAKYTKKFMREQDRVSLNKRKKNLINLELAISRVGYTLDIYPRRNKV